MRSPWILPWMCVLASTVASAQQPPAAADLPAAYRGGEIEQALNAHEWPRAEQLLAAAIERAPASPALLEVIGSVFLIDRKPLNAAIALKKAEAIRPLNNRMRFTLVLAYISLKHGDWARPELERLAAADPANPTYEYWLGRLDYDAGQYTAAIKRFTQVVGRDPGFVRAYDNLGLTYEALNQPEDALKHYRTATELNRRASQKSAWPPLNMGILLRNLGQPNEAEVLLREAAGYEDGLAQAHYQLGALLEQKGLLDEAVTELTRAAARDGAYAEPHYALARIYRQLGRTDEANAALARFERLHDAGREARQQ
jgi:tetratricopeptide (TPR) repeat protein